MNVSLIAPSDERWTALLACQEHDFHHLPSFVALEAERSGGEGAALFLEQAGHQLLIPLVLRDLPEHLGVAGRDAALAARFLGAAFSDRPDFPAFFLGDLLMGAETDARAWPNCGETRVVR